MRAMLVRHPRVLSPELNTEIHYFTHRRQNLGIDTLSPESRRWYADTLPAQSANGTLWSYDKSPSYLDIQEFPKTPHLAKQLLPSAKIIALVCEPVGRAWSQFHHMRRCKEVPESVHTINDLWTVPNFDAMTNFIERGFYADHLREWMDVYGKDDCVIWNRQITDFVKHHQLPEVIALD